MSLTAAAPPAFQPPELGHRETVWEKIDSGARKRIFSFAEQYMRFIDTHRTVREFVAASIKSAKSRGFVDFRKKQPNRIKAGDKYYFVGHGRILALVVVGRDAIDSGVRMVGAHADAVRIDLKQKPLYADGNAALLETHYYGGIKKYHWLSIPLELRGVVVKKDGKRIDVRLGSSKKDPVLVIPDVPVHLSRHVDKVEGEETPAERLDPIAASIPTKSTTEDPFVAGARAALKQRLGLEEADLVAAELELVPAYPARSVGLDSSLIGGYGQDDRACSYAAVRAVFDVPSPRHTAITLIVDKEEVGSFGNTGARSRFFAGVVADLLEAQVGGAGATEGRVTKALSKSMAISADVTAAAHPLWPELHEPRNAVFLGSGPSWDQSGIHAEFLAHIRRLLDNAGVHYQVGDFSKSYGSKRESGTILPFLTELGMDGLDLSIPLLGMHAPFELVSKADLYEGYRAYKAFLSD